MWAWKNKNARVKKWVARRVRKEKLWPLAASFSHFSPLSIFHSRSFSFHERETSSQCLRGVLPRLADKFRYGFGNYFDKYKKRLCFGIKLPHPVYLAKTKTWRSWRLLFVVWNKLFPSHAIEKFILARMLGNTMRYGCKDKFLCLVWVPGGFLRTNVEARIVERVVWTLTARDKYWLTLYLVTRPPSNLSIFFFHEKSLERKKKLFLETKQRLKTKSKTKSLQNDIKQENNTDQRKFYKPCARWERCKVRSRFFSERNRRK